MSLKGLLNDRLILCPRKETICPMAVNSADGHEVLCMLNEVAPVYKASCFMKVSRRKKLKGALI